MSKKKFNPVLGAEDDQLVALDIAGKNFEELSKDKNLSPEQ